jgi:AraC-like DNA-binding protein
VRLAYPKPPHAHLYAALLADVTYVFDAPLTEVEFDATILAEPIVTADPVTKTVAEQAVATAATRFGQVDGVTAQVRKALAENGARRMTLAEVARALQTSTRSLRRALSQTGTSFQKITEDFLRARAEERMRAGDAKIELIARELGFTDARSFRRAFKRWTGQNPNEFRRG